MKKHLIETGMAVLMLLCFYILSREAAETAGKLVNVSGNIKEEKVILVDAGHGGADSGMIGVDGLKEKGINLEISVKLKKVLEKRGYTILMTREEDKGLYEENTKNMKAQDLQNRIAMIKEYKPLLAVSIHQNSYSDPAVKGPQVFFYEDSEKGKRLAACYPGKNEPAAGNQRPPSSQREQDVLSVEEKRGCDQYCRSGFLTNPDEAGLLQKDDYQQKVALAIADGIDEYLASEKNEKN